MLEKKRFSLEDMQESFKQEADSLESRISKNLLRISEIDEYLDSLYKKEDEDFKVFSPWNVEYIYKDDIGNHKTEKYSLENDNKLLYSRLNKVNSYLSALEDEIARNSVKAVAPSGADTSVSISDGNTMQRDRKVLDIQESERQRIARDLHDTSLQNLAHLVHKIELASMYIDKDTVQAKLELATVNKNLKAVIEEIRNTIFDLRPMSFDDLGLKESFERLFSKLKEMNRSFDFEVEMDEIVSDDEVVLMNIFRVVQEACLNAIKHSGGNKIKVEIIRKVASCYISVKDNGSAFSMEDVIGQKDQNFGISIMKERVNLLGGEISFYTTEGEGTEVVMNIPL